MKIFKIGKTIAFFGFLLILLGAIFNLQDKYTDIIKNIYENKITTYLGIVFLCVTWIFWEVTVMKSNRLWIYLVTIGLGLITAILINGFFGFLGIAIVMAGIIIALINKKPKLHFVPTNMEVAK